MISLQFLVQWSSVNVFNVKIEFINIKEFLRHGITKLDKKSMY